jgi:prevent-host-death family protein
MRTIKFQEAQHQLSRLVEEAAQGDSFVIEKAGRPMVKVVPLEQNEFPKKRLGILPGMFSVPDDFDRMGEEEIAGLFGTTR